MDSLLTASLTALWLGILTSISPCPLATNIAAISYIGKRVGSIGNVLLSGVAYSIGRLIAYLVVGIVVVAGLLSVPSVSAFLQRYMILVMGPVLIVAGMFLLELLSINLAGKGGNTVMQRYADSGGVPGSLLLGIIFALSFCPVSAALFFGSLIPLAVSRGSILLMPSLYGLGTGLPVMGFALLIALGARSVGTVFNRLIVFERWARRITGLVFIGVGVYLTLKYIFNIL